MCRCQQHNASVSEAMQRFPGDLLLRLGCGSGVFFLREERSWRAARLADAAERSLLARDDFVVSQEETRVWSYRELFRGKGCFEDYSLVLLYHESTLVMRDYCI